MTTSASRAPEARSTRGPATPRHAAPRAAILSDRAETIAEAAFSVGLATDCADAETLWLLPWNAPQILFLDLPVAGVTPRRAALLVRQLCRACPDLVILAANPNPALPCDIEVEAMTEDHLAEAFAEACHLLRPVPGPTSLFHRHTQKRLSLFR